MSNTENFLERLTDPADGGKTLKTIFDHVRNYMVCGVLMGLGVFVFKHGSMMTQVQEIGWVTGPVIFLLGLLLYPLNFIVFVRYLAEKKLAKNATVSKLVFVVVMLLVVFVVGDITYSVVFQAIGKM